MLSQAEPCRPECFWLGARMQMAHHEPMHGWSCGAMLMLTPWLASLKPAVLPLQGSPGTCWFLCLQPWVGSFGLLTSQLPSFKVYHKSGRFGFDFLLKLWMLLRKPCGQLDAPRRWWLQACWRPKALGLRQHFLDPCCFLVYAQDFEGLYGPDTKAKQPFLDSGLVGIICLHVDDMLGCGNSTSKIYCMVIEEPSLSVNGRMAIHWSTTVPQCPRALMALSSSTTRSNSTCLMSSRWPCPVWGLNMNSPNWRWPNFEGYLVLFSGLLSKAVLIYKRALLCTPALSQKVFSRRPWTRTACSSLPRGIIAMWVWLFPHSALSETFRWSLHLMRHFAADLIVLRRVVTLCSWPQSMCWKPTGMCSVPHLGLEKLQAAESCT